MESQKSEAHQPVSVVPLLFLNEVNHPEGWVAYHLRFGHANRPSGRFESCLAGVAVAAAVQA